MERFLYYLERVNPFWWILLAVFLFTFSKINRRKYLLEERSIIQAIACTLFPAYILMIFVFTVFIRLPNNEYSAYLMPLWSYREILKTHNSELLFETIGNILFFIPVGVLLPLCEYRKKNNTCFMLVFGLLLTLFVELFQFTTRVGTFETDDILNNSLGMLLGYSAVMVIKRICVYIKKRRNIV